MPKSIGDQLQKISHQALATDNLFKQRVVNPLIWPTVNKIANLLSVHWAFRLGSDAYLKTLKNASLVEIEWCMRQIIYTQLSLKEAFSGLHGFNPAAIGDISGYDNLFIKITNQHNALYKDLKEQRDKLIQNSNSLNASATPSSSYTHSHYPTPTIDSLDFLFGMMDATTGTPSNYIFFAGPEYFSGYVTELSVEALGEAVLLAARGVGVGVNLAVSAVDSSLDMVATNCITIDEDCCQCCGGGCITCAGGSAKVVATAGGGVATLGSQYVDPVSATQAATAHHAGMFSHAAWSKFLAPTIGSAATLFYTCVTGLPVLYNFMHSLYGKLIKGGDRNTTASRDRWVAAQDLGMSIGAGGIMFFSFLAILGPHAAITMLILGMFAGDRGSKYIRRGNEREAMGGVHKPQKWVPTTARLKQLAEIEAKPNQTPVNGTEELLAFKNRFPLDNESQHEAENIYFERKKLEELSTLSNSCYRIAQKEKATAQANTNFYYGLFSHYKKTVTHATAMSYSDEINTAEIPLEYKKMNTFVSSQR